MRGWPRVCSAGVAEHEQRRAEDYIYIIHSQSPAPMLLFRPPQAVRPMNYVCFMSCLERHVHWWGGGGRETDTTSSVRPWSHAAGHHLICYTLPSVSAWESAAAISITYRGGELFILPGSNPESIDERVGGGGGQCEVVELGQRAVRMRREINLAVT